jgi:hypothetical protein
MKIVGCDLHTRYQQIAMLDEETGELIERRLEHESGRGALVLRGAVRGGAGGKNWGQTGRSLIFIAEKWKTSRLSPVSLRFLCR